MLKEAYGISRIYIATGFTDLRKGIDGLTYLVQEQFDLNPLQKGTFFLFCVKRTDRIKCLVFEGFLLLYHRLVPSFRYHWPRTPQEAKELSWAQFDDLMWGFNPLQEGLIGEVKPARFT